MGKKKIADSIIIRVGGGIRAFSREPVESAEPLNSVRRESGFEQKGKMHPVSADQGADAQKAGPDKIAN